MFGQLLLQARADGVVRQYLPSVDLGEPFSTSRMNQSS
jgi:hypothetical protein